MSKDSAMLSVDGNEAVASVAYRLSELIAIYPITPASPMGEWADEWAGRERPNLWGQVPRVVEMQSEAGAAGTLHGALQTGTLGTTFTSSQGLLLMVPDLYKIAGQLMPCVVHVAARSLATHALSIFCDHSDVMACRQIGMGMLASASVQEAQDMALVSHAAALAGRVPFLHFFDGFRTSHEVNKIEGLADAQLQAMIDPQWIVEHRGRGLSPERPSIRGTAANPDTFFQAREAANPFYQRCPGIVAEMLDRFAQITGRRYGLFDYAGHPNARRVVVVMGSASHTLEQTARHLVERGEEVGVLRVRLFRPFSVEHFLTVLPRSVERIAVLDRTKEPGAVADPLQLDIIAALHQGWDGPTFPRVVGGRYGLSSKEFTPAMAKAVFDHLKQDRPRSSFTVGINDDVTHTSLPYDSAFDIEPRDVFRAMFYGVGSDGTVGANKNTIKILGDQPGRFAQGYFVYDSKKSGTTTVSHLRFGPRPIEAPYLIQRASFLGCHQFSLLQRLDVLEAAEPGAIVLLNAPFELDRVWDNLPETAQRHILDKKLRVYVIDAYRVAREAGLGSRINTVMQVCFFALCGLMPREEAIDQIKAAIAKSYGRKGPEIVRQNHAAVDSTLEHLHELEIPHTTEANGPALIGISHDAPDFVQRITAMMLAGQGDRLPVSAMSVDGTWPVGTTRWEKRDIATAVPVWDAELCIQCNKCAMVCPHAAIRAKVFPTSALEGAPEGFPSAEYKTPDFRRSRYTIQVSPEDCTGCQLCVEVCPARDKADPKHKAVDMTPVEEVRQREHERFDFFLNIPEVDRSRIGRLDAKGSQLLQPLIEYSGACAGCGETPYIKLLTQLFGSRLMISNATGCSSIYGGNLPTTPYCANSQGRGPAWANSLFEDNAEFGLGLRLSSDFQTKLAREMLKPLAEQVGPMLAEEILAADVQSEKDIEAQQHRIGILRSRLRAIDSPQARQMVYLADALLPRSVWIVGGDGWAYDIGFGGLDHVLGSDHNLKVLVLDTELYSNTGGQASKATPLGAVARFASGGKGGSKKDLGLMAMSYGHIYVASVALGANDNHTVQAILEAESYPGPALVIAYSHCIAHGYDLRHGLNQQKLAVRSGVWPLYRYDPRRTAEGKPALKIDAPVAKEDVENYLANETRFRSLAQQNPQRYEALRDQLRHNLKRRAAFYEHLAGFAGPIQTDPADPAPDQPAEHNQTTGA